MNRHVRAEVETATQVGRVESRVDHDRDMVFGTDRCDGFEIHDVEAGTVLRSFWDESIPVALSRRGRWCGHADWGSAEAQWVDKYSLTVFWNCRKFIVGIFKEFKDYWGGNKFSDRGAEGGCSNPIG